MTVQEQPLEMCISWLLSTWEGPYPGQSDIPTLAEAFAATLKARLAEEGIE